MFPQLQTWQTVCYNYTHTYLSLLTYIYNVITQCLHFKLVHKYPCFTEYLFLMGQGQWWQSTSSHSCTLTTLSLKMKSLWCVWSPVLWIRCIKSNGQKVMEEILGVMLQAPTSLHSRAEMTRNGKAWVFTPPVRKTGTKKIQPKCSPAMSDLKIFKHQCPAPMVIWMDLKIMTNI